MSTEVKIPAVGESIPLVYYPAGSKQNGDTVSDGEPIFALETDKILPRYRLRHQGNSKSWVEAGQEVKSDRSWR